MAGGKTAWADSPPDHGWYRRDPILAVGTAFAYFCLATATILLTSYGHHIATVWPANAVVVAMLMAVPRRRWPIYLIAGFIGNAAATIATKGSSAALFGYGITNIVETMVAVTLLRGGSRDIDIASDLGSVTRFFVACGLAAPGISAISGATTAHYLSGQSFRDSYVIFFLSDGLGLLIFTPIFIGLRNGEIVGWVRGMTAKRRYEAVGLLIAATAVAITVFSVRSPLLFVLTVPVMMAAVRLGRFGTKIMVTLIAIAGTIATINGYGPIAKTFTDREQEAHALQLFLATLLLTALPVSAELTARRALARRLQESETGLRLLASGSADALVQIDEAGICRHATHAAEAVLGVHGAAIEGLTLAGTAIAEDGDRIDQALAEAAATPGDTIYCEFRPRLRPGRWTECSIKALTDERGKPMGAVAAVRDVTSRKQREIAAERAAAIDSLTGTLNRAAFLDQLDERIVAGTPFSMVMIDVDLFKQVNDTHGHPAG